jgi:hypothetical protein
VVRQRASTLQDRLNGFADHVLRPA